MADIREEGTRRNRFERGLATPIRIGVIFGQYGVPGAVDISSKIKAVAAREDLFHDISMIPLGFSGPIMELTADGRIPDTLSPNRELLRAPAQSEPCSLLVFAAHTIEYFRHNIEASSESTVLSPVEVALKEAEAIGAKRIGVIGYSSTKLIRGLYENPLREKGIEFATIPDTISHGLDGAIDSFVAGRLSLEEFAATAQAACTNLLEQDVQAIILACSELPIGLHLLEDKTRKITINPNKLLAEAVVKEVRKHLKL